MYSKSITAFFLAIGLTSTLGAPQLAGPVTGQRPVYNEGGLLPDVGALLNDLTTGLNEALGGRPIVDGYPGNAPVQPVQPMQPVQPSPQFQAVQPIQPVQPFQQYRTAARE